MQTLSVADNLLSTLPDWLARLPRLEHLMLSRNTLSSLPPWLGKMTQLRALYLNSNELSSLPAELGRLTRLRVLSLSSNELSSLPAELGSLARLQELSIDDNHLVSLPAWVGRLTGLRKLVLAGNHLTSLPTELGKLTQLQELDVSDNQIASLPAEVAQLTKLRNLYLQGNQLTLLPAELGNLTQLQELDASENQISSLPVELGQLSSLQLLDLGRNKLPSLPSELRQLTGLKRLDLSGNPLDKPLAAAYAQGLDATLAYLRGLAEETTRRYEIKVVLVGEGRTGKTTLVDALLGEAFRPHDMTHGVERRSREQAHPDPAVRQPLRLNFWDFGGQEAYQIAHPLFFTHRALYLLVWHAREGLERGRVRWWLRQIKQRVGDTARVLLVATNGRENRQAAVPLAELRAEFGDDIVAGQFVVDSAPDELGYRLGINELRAAVARHATEILGGGEAMPGAWSRVRDALADRAAFEMPYAEFARVCRAQGVRDEDVPRLATLLHLLGDVLYYAEREGLRDRIILHPDWPVGAVDDLLGDPELAAAGGVIDHDRLAAIWSAPARGGRKVSFPASAHPFLRQLLEQFDLTYQVEEPPGARPGQRLLFAPRIPERRHREPPWSQAEADIRFIWESDDKLPAAVIPMLIARNFDRSTGLHWQGGVFLKDRYHDAQALIELVDGGRSVQLSLRGVEADWLFGLRDGVERVLQGWRDLRTDLLVPCPRCERGRFDYQQLLARRKRGKADATCSGRGGCGEDVPISRLLYGVPRLNEADALMPSRVLSELAEIRTNLDSLRASQGKLLKISTDVRGAVGRAAAETKALLRQVLKDLEREALDGPRLFTLLPDGSRTWRRVARAADPRRDVFELLLWCEYPSGYHPVEAARYVIRVPREWWVRAAPLVRVTAQALRMMVPVLVKLPEVLAGEDEVQHLKADLELVERLATIGLPPGEAYPSGLDEGEASAAVAGDSKAERELRARLAADTSGRAAGGLADGAVLRELHTILARMDPQRRWGGLQRIRVRSSDELAWMCPAHYHEFSQPTGRVAQ